MTFDVEDSAPFLSTNEPSTFRGGLHRHAAMPIHGTNTHRNLHEQHERQRGSSARSFFVGFEYGLHEDPKTEKLAAACTINTAVLIVQVQNSK